MRPTALYRHFDASGRLLYVGATRDPIGRTNTHATKAHWYGEIARIEIQWFDTREEAAAAEDEAIASEAPLHNRLMTGQGFPEILPDGPMTLAEFTEAVRVRKGVVAERIGISATYLSQILAGVKRPSFDLMVKIERETGGAVPLAAWVREDAA